MPTSVSYSVKMAGMARRLAAAAVVTAAAAVCTCVRVGHSGVNHVLTSLSASGFT